MNFTMKRNKFYKEKKIVAMVIICLFVTGLFSTSATAGREQMVTIVVRAEPQEIIEGEELPEFTVDVTANGDEQTILNPENNYTVRNLMDDLSQGIGYTIGTEMEEATEGRFPIQIRISEELEQSMLNEWLGMIRIRFEQGTLTVRNQEGEWYGDRFRRPDGTYVKSEFVTSRGRVFYLDENGYKVVGWQDIQGNRYYFNDNGVRQTGWLTRRGERYFLDTGGRMTTGWLRYDEEQFYFDREGRMLTGEYRIGTLICVFAECGRLVSLRSEIDPDRPMIALTFDDGPGERTIEILDKLEQYGSSATFFLLGSNVTRRSEVVEEIAASRSEIGNHSFTHTILTSLNKDAIRAEVEGTNHAIEEIIGESPTLFRPPYGATNHLIRTAVDMPMILWTVDTLDWRYRNVQTIIDNVLNNAGDGDVVLLHDIHDATVDATLILIPELVSRGYQLVTVSELAEAKGIYLENGEIYFQ